MSFIFGLIVLAGIFSSAAYKLSQERNVILITDMEPDDRIALLVASINIAHRILFIGTTLMNSQRKAALVRHQLSFFKNGMQKVEVFAGSGGKPADFRLEIDSNKAGLSYIDEGKNIFSHKKLKEFENKTASSENELQKNIVKALEQASRKGIKLEFILLAAPTDLTAILGSKHVGAIKRIYVMGGWVEVLEDKEDKKGKEEEKEKIMVRRTTYNVNMDVKASTKLMNFAHEHKVPLTLWSSHVTKNVSGGSVNADNPKYTELIDMIYNSPACLFQAIQSATASWDAHLIKEIKPLAERIGKFQGRQFTPADPVAMVGFLHPEMIESPENYIVNIDQVYNKAGYKVELTKNDQSTITVVGGIDEDMFKNEMERSIRMIMEDQESQTEGGGNCIVM